MKLEFNLTENDFLNFQLFTAAHSKRIQNKKLKGWIILTVSPAALSIFSYKMGDNFTSIYCGVLSVIFAIFYPLYFKLVYKRHYKAYTKEVFSKRTGTAIEIELFSDVIVTKDKLGEGRFKVSEITKVDETAGQFFVNTSMGNAIIIPKIGSTNHDELRNQFAEMGLNVVDNIGWKW